MPGIEFLGAEAADDGTDDVLSTGPRRPVPRWVWAVAALLVVAVGVGAVVSSRSDQTPDARPSASPSDSVAPPSADSGPAAQISALASDGTSLFWVAGSEIFRAGPVGRAAVSAPISPAGGDFAELQLVPDPAERTIWVVSRGENDRNPGGGSIEGFSTTDLSVRQSGSTTALISGAAAFHGALYLLSGGQLLRTTARPSETGFTTIARIDDGRAHGLVATDRELLFVEGSSGDALGAWSPSSGVGRRVPLETTDSVLATIGSTIFVAGTRAGRDVLDTLRPPAGGGGVDRRGIVTGLTSGVQIVAAGARSLLLVGQASDGLRLACVAVPGSAGVPAATSAPAVSANVAALRGVVFQAAGQGVRPADLGRCPG